MLTGNLTGDVTGNVMGDVNGNLTGDVTGNVIGDVNGNLTGDVIGNVTGNLTGNVIGHLTGDVSACNIDISDDLTVGGDASLCDVSACNIDISDNLVVFGDASFCDVSACNIDVTGEVKGDHFFGDLTGDVKGDIIGNLIGDVTGNVTGDVRGNLTGNVIGDVTGNLTGDITGNVIADVTGNLTGNVIGDVTGNLTGNVIGDVTGNLTGNVIGDVTGNLTGNVIGDVTGNLTGNVIGDVTGNLTGNVIGDVTGNLTGNVIGDVTGNLTGNVIGDVTGNLTGNVIGDVTGNLTGNVIGDVTGNLTGNVIGDVTGNLTGNVIGDVTGDVTGNLTGNVIGDVTGDVTGNLTGNVIGDVTGNLTGNVMGDVTGNLTGNVIGDVTGNLTGNVTGHLTGDVSACNIDISDDLTVGGDASLCDVSACSLELYKNYAATFQNLDLRWTKDSNLLEEGSFALPPTNPDFRLLEIVPGDILTIFYIPTYPPAAPQTNIVVTVREIDSHGSWIKIAERFKVDNSLAMPLAVTGNSFGMVVHKVKLKMTTRASLDAFSTWRLDNLGDLHVIPSGESGKSGAPPCDGEVNIWGLTRILRGADPTGAGGNGDSRLEITCFNSEGHEPGEAWLDMKASNDKQPCRIMFGNVGNSQGVGSVVCERNLGIGRIEYFNSTDHLADRMAISVSGGGAQVGTATHREALSINTNATYGPFVGIGTSAPTCRLTLDVVGVGDLLAMNNTAQDIKLTMGTDVVGGYIDTPAGTTWTGGTRLFLKAGGLTVAVCEPTQGVPYPNSFDLTSQKLTIRGAAGTAGQVLTATGTGSGVEWATPVGGGANAIRDAIHAEPFGPTVTLGWVSIPHSGAGDVYMHQFHAPSTGRYDRMTLSMGVIVSSTTGVYNGYIGVALYSNIEVNGKPGRPNGNPIAKGVNNYTANGLGSQVLAKEYVTVEFDNSIELTANTLYWAAMSCSGWTPTYQTLRFVRHIDYDHTQNKVIELSATTTLSTGTWPNIAGAAGTGIDDTALKAFWFRIEGPATAAGTINDLTVYGNLDVLGDLVALDVSASNIDISDDLTVGGDASLCDVSACNIDISYNLVVFGDASFCDVSACNIDAAGTVNISNTAGLPNKLVMENTGTQLWGHAPYDYDNTQNTNGYSYIKCLTGGLPAFQVDGDGSIKNRKSITITQEDAGWHNNQLRTTLGLTLIAKMQTGTTYDSLITTGYNTQVGGQVNETRKKLVGLALQASGESSFSDRGIVKVIPNFGSNYTEFQFDNSTNVLGNGGTWENTLWWTNNNDGTNQNSLYMSANNLGGRPKFQFKSGTEMILEWDPTISSPSPRIALGNPGTNIKLGSGVQNPFTYSQSGSKVSCSYIDSNDISCNTFRGDYIDSLRYNQLTIGQKSTYVEIACSGTAPTWLSRGGIHLGIDSDITCGDSTINCTSNSNICNTRHMGTIGTFSGSSSCGTRLRGYSTITMTSIVSGIASKLCVIKNEGESAPSGSFLTCSSIEGPQATILMRGQAVLHVIDPGDVVNVQEWYTGKMVINIDSATVVSGGELRVPHSVSWSQQQQQGMPPGTFNKMFDVAKATFMVTSGTILQQGGAVDPIAWVASQDPRNPVFDYKWLYAKRVETIPNNGEAQFEIGARMMGFDNHSGGGRTQGLIVNYLITVPRRFWGNGGGQSAQPQTFFANVRNNTSNDPSGEFFWNPYKSTDELSAELGPWDNDGPKHMREDEDDDHNHEEYLSGNPQPGDPEYVKTFTEVTLDNKGSGKYANANGDFPPAAAWMPFASGPTGAGFTVNNQFYSHEWRNAVGGGSGDAVYDNMWLQYELSSPEKVVRYSFTLWHDPPVSHQSGEAFNTYIRDYRGRMPQSFTLWGSNDGTNFVKLDIQTNVDWDQANAQGITATEDRHFEFSNTVAYNFYRVTLEKRGTSYEIDRNEKWVRIVQIKLWT